VPVGALPLGDAPSTLLAGLFVPAVAAFGAPAFAEGNKSTAPTAASSSTTGTTSTSATAAESKDALFARLDANKDGKLSSDEGRQDSKVQGLWTQLDADNDGSVTQAEFMATPALEAAPKK